MNFETADLFLVVGIAECLLWIALCGCLPSKDKNAKRSLIALLSLLAFESFLTLYIWHPAAPLHTYFAQAVIGKIYLGSHILLGPALWWYVLALTQTKASPLSVLSVSFAPLILGLGVFEWQGLMLDDLKFQSDFEPGLWTAKWLWVFAKLAGVGFVVLGFITLSRATNLLDILRISQCRELRWLVCLLTGFLLLWLWGLIIITVAATGNAAFADKVGQGYNYLFFVLINALIYFSVAYNSHLPKNAEAGPQEDQTLVTQNHLHQILQGIERHQLHLQPGISLGEYAEQVGLGENDMSTILNRELNQNFFEFINAYRVEEAKRLLADPENRLLSVLDILLRSGFNSKSSFHRFFNRLVGTTPSEFRRQCHH